MNLSNMARNCPHKLERNFYLRPDVVAIAKEMIGKMLFTGLEGGISAGIITETEAYAGINDKASHAYNGKRTARTEIMYRQGGVAYVYLCYGIHSLFNIVTNHEGIPHAVLVRAILPVEGKELMSKRLQRQVDYGAEIYGPGLVSKALGIHFSHTGADLCEHKIWLCHQLVPIELEIAVSERVGVHYADLDALLPYRFTGKIAKAISTYKETDFNKWSPFLNRKEMACCLKEK